MIDIQLVSLPTVEMFLPKRDPYPEEAKIIYETSWVCELPQRI